MLSVSAPMDWCNCLGLVLQRNWELVFWCCGEGFICTWYVGGSRCENEPLYMCWSCIDINPAFNTCMPSLVRSGTPLSEAAKLLNKEEGFLIFLLAICSKREETRGELLRFDPVSRICCLLCRLICSPGCHWCCWLLNVSFSSLAWFLLPLFLFICLEYQFVTQMNYGWSRLLPRWHVKLIIVMCFLAKTRSTAPPHFWLTDELTHWDTLLLPWFSVGCCAQVDEEWRPREKDMKKSIRTKGQSPYDWLRLSFAWSCTLLSCTASVIHPSIHTVHPLPLYSHSGTWQLQTMVVSFGEKRNPIKVHLVYWVDHNHVLYKCASLHVCQTRTIEELQKNTYSMNTTQKG